jgi:multidrug resistance efflux pump
MTTPRPRIVVASSADDASWARAATRDAAWLRRAADDLFDIPVVALDGLEASGAAVVVVDLEHAAVALATLPDAAPPVLVIGEAARAPGDPRVWHVIRRGLGDDQVRILLAALAARRPFPAPPRPPPQSQDDARRAQRAFAASRRLAGASDLGAIETIAADVLAELIDADRASCLFHDAGDGSLWSEAKLRGAEGDDRRAIAGLAGFAARTGLAATTATRAGDDPRFVAAIDDPRGDASSHVLVQPVLGADGAVHAVLIAARNGRRQPFGEVEASLLADLAALAAPFLDQLSIHIEAQAILEEGREDGLFRREAIEAQALPRWGDVVRVSPAWLSWAYWLLVVLLIGSGLYVTFGTVSTYSSGVAVIRSTARTEIAARTSGNVTSVEVAAGATVEPGAILARLDDANQRAAVDRLEHEFETQLRNHMLDPGDAAADGALRGLRLELESARTSVEDRLVRATAGGVVTDVRVRAGQQLAPGDIVASIVEGGGALEVVALLPGSDRPQLGAGMPLRLELMGYRYAYQALVIDSVSTDVIAATEARRVLGPDVADSLRVGGPVVLVRGRLPRTEFEVDGRTFQYHDGMLGTAEVRVRSERILFTLIPGARRF